MTDIAEIRKLPVPERLRLVGEIWESIVDAPEFLPVFDALQRLAYKGRACRLQERRSAIDFADQVFVKFDSSAHVHSWFHGSGTITISHPS
jgi:hypothetical protein